MIKNIVFINRLEKISLTYKLQLSIITKRMYEKELDYGSTTKKNI